MLDFIEPTLKEELRSFAVDVWQAGGVCFSLNFPFLSSKKQIPSQALVAESAFARWNSGPEEKNSPIYLVFPTTFTTFAPSVGRNLRIAKKAFCINVLTY